MVRDHQGTEFSPQIFSCVVIVIKPSVGPASVRYDARVSFYNWQEGEEL